MNPPPQLASSLAEYDRGLRARWAEALGRFCIERRHGFVGRTTTAILDMLLAKWKRLEAESDAAPNDIQLEHDERRAYDEFRARVAGYQPIFYITASDAYHIKDVVYKLINMDIRRAGGPAAFMRNMRANDERAAYMRRLRRRNQLRELADRAATIAMAKKDFYASGGDLFSYAHEKR